MNTSEEYEQFKQLFQELTGMQLDAYKQPQMKRRLTSLCEKRQFANLVDYGIALKSDEALLAECLEKVTINVSAFFRNYNRWEVLRTSILPGLVQRRGNGLRIWSAACSTGEEAYTLAAICREDSIKLANEVLTATDIDEVILERAAMGKYKAGSLKEMPLPLIDKYLEKHADTYTVQGHLRKCIRFSRLDLVDGRYPQDCDLIVCRNVLIYFTDEAKHEVFKKFSEALTIGGVLFVGSTEQIFNPQQYGLKAIASFFYQKI